MGIVSIAGIVIGILAFIVLSSKGFSMILGAIVAAAVIAATSAQNPLSAMAASFMPPFAAFIQNYFLLFVFAALFGKVMEDSGSVRRIALSAANQIKKTKHPKYFAVLTIILFYFLLCYSGVNGYVIVFTVLVVGRDLYEECDVPWLYYVYGGSAGAGLSFFTPGSLHSANLITANTMGVSLSNCAAFSFIGVAAYCLATFLLLHRDLKKAERRGEGFLPSGADVKAVQVESQPDEDLPALVPALIPLFVPIVSIVFLALNVQLALILGTLCCLAFNFRHYRSADRLKRVISTGVTASASPLLGVSACTGLVSVIQSTSGFSLILTALDHVSPLFSGLTLSALTSLAVASAYSWIPTLGHIVVERFMAAGISYELSCRLLTVAGWSYLMPQNPGVVNVLGLSRISFAKGAWQYWKCFAVPMASALAAMLLCSRLGIFV